MPESPLPLLLQLMFGESAHISLDLLSPRLLSWAAAFDAWLETRNTSRRNYNDSRCAWKYLLALVRKPPWDITRADLETHRAWLDERGLSPGTVRHHISFIHMFYSWCGRKAIDPLAGPDFNPAAGAWQHQGDYSKAQALTEQESTALLRLLKHDPWLLSKRDYAFFLCRLWMGVPYKWIYQLKWGQIQVQQDGAWVDWGPGVRSTCLPEEA
jgi:integrase